MGADLGLNFSAAARLCNDKYFAANILQQAGLSVIESQIIHSSDTRGLNELKFPCIVKPNKGAGGDGLSLVNTLSELDGAIELAQRFDRQTIIQNRYMLREFRIVVLDGQLLYAYEKSAWKVHGDGESSIADFVVRYNSQIRERYEISLNDLALTRGLLSSGKTLSTVLPLGDTYELFANANLKKGAKSVEVERLAPEYVALAVQACSVLGLRYGGVDLFAAEPEVLDESYRLIEVNSSPGFDFLRRDQRLMQGVLDVLAIAMFDD